MDVRRLELFLAVADHGGFTAASLEVPVSQPGISLAVKELEAELGVRLFERLGRRTLLTPAGQALVGPARQALRDVSTGAAAVAAVKGVTAGTLGLASLPTLAADPLAGLVGAFRLAHPGVTVELASPENTSDLLAMVRDGRCEVGLTEAAELPAELVSHDLRAQELLLVLPPGSPPAAPTVSLAELAEVADIPFVAGPAGTSTRRLLDESFAAIGIRPRIVVVTAQRDAMLPLVLAGAGAALVPEPVADVAALLGAVVRRPSPRVSRRLVLVHRTGALAPAASRFVEMARSAPAGGSAGGDGRYAAATDWP